MSDLFYGRQPLISPGRVLPVCPAYEYTDEHLD